MNVLRTFPALLLPMLWFLIAASSPALAQVVETLPSQVDEAVMGTIFSGSETMHYAVSWSGGVKIGDIYMDIQPDTEKKGGYRITARVKDYGPLKLFYPVDDTFACSVYGPMKLPHRYEVVQKEGFSGKETRRMTWYDQVLKYVRYQKNDEQAVRYELAGTTYNEFASFVITRALRLSDSEDVVVPTFVDSKRHEVRVSLLQKEKRQTIFGLKDTLKVQPRMHFKGLYDKDGDTILWLTDDKCRVPVEINSRIVIGSLVAELVDYANPACTELKKRSTP